MIRGYKEVNYNGETKSISLGYGGPGGLMSKSKEYCEYCPYWDKEKNISKDECFARYINDEFECTGEDRKCYCSYGFNLYNARENWKEDFDDKIELSPDKVDIEAFKTLNQIKMNMDKFILNGGNLYIWSKNVGNGKTSWAKKLCSHGQYQSYRHLYLSEEELSLIKDKSIRAFIEVLGQRLINNDSNDFKPVYLINIPEYLIKLKKSFNDKSLYEDMKTYDLIFENAPLVAFDDIATKMATDYDREVLYSIINKRIEKGLANIYTSNNSPEELDDLLGARLKSRITSTSIIVELQGNDRREISNPTTIEELLKCEVKPTTYKGDTNYYRPVVL